MSVLSSGPVRALKHVLRIKPVAAKRLYPRHPCNLDAYLVLEGQRYEVKGVIGDISRQGTLFRPRSEFIMKLQNVPIELRVGYHVMHGKVVNTITRGYGIEFFETIPEDLIEELSIKET